jgi:hypothetical protein
MNDSLLEQISQLVLPLENYTPIEVTTQENCYTFTEPNVMTILPHSDLKSTLESEEFGHIF